MALQRDSTIDLTKAIIDKNECMTKVVAEACNFVLELEILDVEPVDVWIQKLAVGVCEARTKLAKVQFELNLKIVELYLKA